MRLTEHELKQVMETTPNTEEMSSQGKREWMLSKMQTIHDLRAEHYSFDDIALRYPLTANSIRKIYRQWLADNNKTDPRER